jgi:hypothetical protein
MKKILLIIFLLSSTASFANISGDWTGWGTWTYEGAGAVCDPMTLGFVETKDKLTRTGGAFNCQVADIELDEAEWVKKGKDLLVDGVIVGSISENTVHLTEKYSEDVSIVTDIKMEARHLDYSETWYDEDNIVIYEIQGRFFKK